MDGILTGKKGILMGPAAFTRTCEYEGNTGAGAGVWSWIYSPVSINKKLPFKSFPGLKRCVECYPQLGIDISIEGLLQN